MAYIDRQYYESTFKGNKNLISNAEFERILDIASDVVYDIALVKPSETDVVNGTFKKAVAYEVEFLIEQGGIDAILGFSNVSLSGTSESLGDYSVGAGKGSSAEVVAADNGIPVSPMTLMLLERLGLMARWVYAERYRRCLNGE